MLEFLKNQFFGSFSSFDVCSLVYSSSTHSSILTVDLVYCSFCVSVIDFSC